MKEILNQYKNTDVIRTTKSAVVITGILLLTACSAPKVSNKLDAARKVSATLNETAELAYLKAIIEARSGASADAVVAKLKTAIAKNAALKEKARKDREFIKLMNDASFIELVK